VLIDDLFFMVITYNKHQVIAANIVFNITDSISTMFFTQFPAKLNFAIPRVISLL